MQQSVVVSERGRSNMGAILYCIVIIGGAAISGYTIGRVFTEIIIANLRRKGKF